MWESNPKEAFGVDSCALVMRDMNNLFDSPDSREKSLYLCTLIPACEVKLIK